MKESVDSSRGIQRIWTDQTEAVHVTAVDDVVVIKPCRSTHCIHHAGSKGTQRHN